MRGNFQGNQLPTPLELSGLPTSPPAPSQVDLIGLGVLNFPEQKRARQGGRRDRVSRGGDRAGQRGEREPGQSEGKEVQRGMKERWAALGRSDRGNRPGMRLGSRGQRIAAPGRRAGCSRKRADSYPRRRRLLLLEGLGGRAGGSPRTTAPAGLKAAPSPPLPPTRLPSPRPLSPQSLRPRSAQPPPPQPPVPPRPDSPPLAKPDRAEPAADTRNQPPRPRPRLTLTGCPSQSTPTCPHPPPILGRELQTGALFGQWQQGAQEAAC
ncbi:PREDICTED: formin-like protein 16 [Hipposideros armiger]|uniref:Formin-like protein 16 n=1 Tax=Hipposideros armiger TaxID=186990 RepID=A0A8B7RQM0_HIPAR|nr:PREDICTED: formin-like protein 16 [Hipposideros armiger]